MQIKKNSLKELPETLIQKLYRQPKQQKEILVKLTKGKKTYDKTEFI